MSMEFSSGFIRRVDYDEGQNILEIRFENHQVLAYTGVPRWIFDKICRDPRPQSFWEDQIKDEYGLTRAQKLTHSQTHSTTNLDALNNLFK